jgi:hypothetical protein
MLGVTRCRSGIVLLAIALGSVLGAAPAAGVDHLLIQQDIVRDARPGGAHADEYLDTTLLASWSQAHAAVTLGSFDAGMEVGAFWRDRRGSAYAGTLRRRTGGRVENTSLEFESLQKWGRTLFTGGLKGYWPDHPEGRAFLLVPALGTEVYFGSNSFVSLRAALDPRPGTGLLFRIANRLGDARHHVDVALAPRTNGACGWSVRGRYEVFVAGFGAEPEFDFTSIDRQIWFLGFEYDLHP